jgi:hypothetical protein
MILCNFAVESLRAISIQIQIRCRVSRFSSLKSFQLENIYPSKQGMSTPKRTLGQHIGTKRKMQSTTTQTDTLTADTSSSLKFEQNQAFPCFSPPASIPWFPFVVPLCAPAMSNANPESRDPSATKPKSNFA